ncbi:odorant receptor 43a-like isoform X2 [Anoplolepis gracilipes]|uniref:odorant receptor 43a-like isoform X2 n=1 Tax=Anoplolepis gracilipes TaxID=354296 RepID=UPI003B9E08A1
MQILSFNFFLYTISGLWRPIEWSSKCSRILYNMFTYLIMCLLLIQILAQLLDIIFIVDNMDDFTTNSYIFVSVIGIFFKAATVVTRRNEIINVIETLQKKPCKACTEEESDILMKFDRLIRSYSINYMYLATFSAVGGIIGGIFNVFKGQLPFRIWVPYDYSSPIILWLTSIQELIILSYCAIISIATETTVLGFCLQICAQIEILKHRLHNMMKLREKKTSRNSLNDTLNKTGRLSEHILHHLYIIRLAKIINNVFSQVIFVQFFASIIILCTLLYYFSSHMTIIDISTLIVLLICMFVQIFVYCWAGNEVILKSTGLGEAVYQMDWILMPINEQKDLLVIMKRSTRPIKLSSSFLVTLSLESYCNLLKASYSVFNLLHNQS